MNPAYCLRLFGPSQVERDGVSIRAFKSRKALALLGYLACHDQPVDRAHLADLLWGDKPETRGRRNLSRELSQLTALLPGCFEADYHTVCWSPAANAWVDTAAFQTLASAPELSSARGSAKRNGQSPRTSEPSDVWFSRIMLPDLDPLMLAQAVSLYRGEFMAGLYLDGCPEFETWLIREREFWRRQVTEALELLIAHHALHRQDDQAQARPSGPGYGAGGGTIGRDYRAIRADSQRRDRSDKKTRSQGGRERRFRPSSLYVFPSVDRLVSHAGLGRGPRGRQLLRAPG